MGVLDKIMATTLGIGGTKIDTIVHTKNIMPGKRIEGICKIKGGKVEQYIKDITIGVYTNYKQEVDDKKVNKTQRIQESEIKIDKTIQPEELYEIPFSFILYKRVPITKHKSKVWLSTYMDIQGAIDTSDRDYINVEPNEYMVNVLNAISELGFHLREVENEHCPARLIKYNFVQEFEFMPLGGYFRNRLDELELVFVPTNTHVDLVLEVDRKVRGIKSFMSEYMGMDETKLRIRLENYKKYTSDEIKYEIERLLRMYS